MRFSFGFLVVMGKLTAKYRYHVVKQSDQRIRIVNEIIQGIQTIKLYAWELPFLKAIQQIRKYALTVRHLLLLLRFLIQFNSFRFLGRSFMQSAVCL